MQDDDPGTGAIFAVRTSAPLGEFFRSAKAAIAEVHSGFGVEFRVFSSQLSESHSATA